MKDNMIHNKYKILIICFIYLSCFGCNSKPAKTNELAKTNSDDCKTLELSGSFFPDEELVISFNDSIILQQKMDSTVSGYIYRKDFCLSLTDTFKLKLQTFYKSNLVLDTIFTGYGVEEFYSFSTSLPHPLSNEGYIENGKIIKSWGYLPIDSSRRYLKFTARSEMQFIE